MAAGRGRVFRRCHGCGSNLDAPRRHPDRPTRHEARCDGAKPGYRKQDGRSVPDGWSWAYVAEAGKGADGKRRQRLQGGFRTQREAEAALGDLGADTRRGTAVAPSRQTVGEYLTRWLAAVESEYRPGAFATVKLHVERYIVPRLGSVPLQQLTPTTVKGMLADVREHGRLRGAAPLSEKMVHNIFRTLCRALNDAVADQLIPRNPAARAHKMPESPEQATWTAEQLRAFYASVAEDRWFAMWRAFGASGMRRGEGAGLRWSDVDLDAGRLTLTEARVKGDGGVVTGRLKGKRGRSVSLDPVTVAALRAWRKQQAAERLAWPGEWEAGDLVFTHADGTPLHPDSITKTFKKRVKAAGLPWVKLHGLRHGHATLMLQQGEHIKVVQERLGHSSIAITGDVYAHVTPEMDRQAAARVAAFVDGIGEQDRAAGDGEGEA